MSLEAINKLFNEQPLKTIIKWQQPDVGTPYMAKIPIKVQVLEFMILVTVGCYDGNITFKTMVDKANYILYSLYVERYDITNITMTREYVKTGEEYIIDDNCYEMYNDVLTIDYTFADGTTAKIVFNGDANIDFNITGLKCGLVIGYGNDRIEAIASGNTYRPLNGNEKMFAVLSNIRGTTITPFIYDRNIYKFPTNIHYTNNFNMSPRLKPGDVFIYNGNNHGKVWMHVFAMSITAIMNKEKCKCSVIEYGSKKKFNVKWTRGDYTFIGNDYISRNYSYTGAPVWNKSDNSAIIRQLTIIVNYIIYKIIGSEITNV